MFEAYCRDKLGPLILRLALGLVCTYHGFIRIMAKGGMDWSPDLSPGWQMFLAWGDFFGGIAILVGFYTRPAALLVFFLSVWLICWHQGTSIFTMPIHSLEPMVMLLLMGLGILFLGAGGLSVDGRAGSSAGGKPFKKR